jgi:hypothetical protein
VVTSLGLHLPAFVRAGEDVAAEDADGCAGNDVMRVMLARFDPAVCDK